MILPPTFTDTKNQIHAVIESPQGSRHKYVYNPESDFFELKKILPSGTSFPLDYGFIPHTLGEDGDPIDVMVISDAPLFPGCIVESRVVGVFMLKQKENGSKAVRNDVHLAVATASDNHSDIKDIDDINGSLLDEVAHFFKYFHEMEGKTFNILKKGNKSTSLDLLKKGMV